jgi:hypothetical protein
VATKVTGAGEVVNKVGVIIKIPEDERLGREGGFP